MAALPPEAEETSEPLKYKTWVLKVSIHCEGCKRKVKRILHSVEGVYTTDVDTKQHKVIVTGNVDATTLIRKLEKSGKHAELWSDPLKKPSKSIKNVNFDDQQPAPPQHEEEQQNQQQIQNSTLEKVAINVEGGAENNNHTNIPTHQQPQVVKEVRFEANIPVTGDNTNPPGNDVSAGGAKKKKKKKKKGSGGNSNDNVVNNEARAQEQQNGPNNGPPRGDSPAPQQGIGPGPAQYQNPSPENMDQPRHMPHCRVYEYPPAYSAPPAYGVSYNTAYPRAYGASYYSAPPPYSYSYVHQGGDLELPMPSDWNSNSLQPSDTFEIFSDENPNACSVM